MLGKDAGALQQHAKCHSLIPKVTATSHLKGSPQSMQALCTRLQWHQRASCSRQSQAALLSSTAAVRLGGGLSPAKLAETGLLADLPATSHAPCSGQCSARKMGMALFPSARHGYDQQLCQARPNDHPLLTLLREVAS